MHRHVCIEVGGWVGGWVDLTHPHPQKQKQQPPALLLLYLLPNRPLILFDAPQVMLGVDIEAFWLSHSLPCGPAAMPHLLATSQPGSHSQLATKGLAGGDAQRAPQQQQGVSTDGSRTGGSPFAKQGGTEHCQAQCQQQAGAGRPLPLQASGSGLEVAHEEGGGGGEPMSPAGLLEGYQEEAAGMTGGPGRG